MFTARRSVVVSAPGITRTLARGSTCYRTAVFADPVTAALHPPRAWFFGIFSAALLLSGLLGPLAGRTIDRYGGRDVLAATNLVFAAGLAVPGLGPNLAGLAAASALLGSGMGCGFHEAAFATAAGLYGRDARNAVIGPELRKSGYCGPPDRIASFFCMYSSSWISPRAKRSLRICNAD